MLSVSYSTRKTNSGGDMAIAMIVKVVSTSSGSKNCLETVSFEIYPRADPKYPVYSNSSNPMIFTSSSQLGGKPPSKMAILKLTEKTIPVQDYLILDIIINKK